MQPEQTNAMKPTVAPEGGGGNPSPSAASVLLMEA